MALLFDCVFEGAALGTLDSLSIPGYPDYSWVKVDPDSADIMIRAEGAGLFSSTASTVLYGLWDAGAGEWLRLDGPLTMELYVRKGPAVGTGESDIGTAALTAVSTIGGGGEFSSSIGIYGNAFQMIPKVGAASTTGSFPTRLVPDGIHMMAAETTSPSFVRYQFDGVTEGTLSTFPMGDTIRFIIRTDQLRVITRVRIYDGGDPSGGGEPEPEPEPYAHWWRDFANTSVESKT